MKMKAPKMTSAGAKSAKPIGKSPINNTSRAASGQSVQPKSTKSQPKSSAPVQKSAPAGMMAMPPKPMKLKC